jgi:hypothetical protein
MPEEVTPQNIAKWIVNNPGRLPDDPGEVVNMIMQDRKEREERKRLWQEKQKHQ